MTTTAELRAALKKSAQAATMMADADGLPHGGGAPPSWGEGMTTEAANASATGKPSHGPKPLQQQQIAENNAMFKDMKPPALPVAGTPTPGAMEAGEAQGRAQALAEIAKERAAEGRASSDLSPNPVAPDLASTVAKPGVPGVPAAPPEPDVNDPAVASAMGAGLHDVRDERAPTATKPNVNDPAIADAMQQGPDAVAAHNANQGDPGAGSEGEHTTPTLPAADPGIMAKVQSWVSDPENQKYLIGGAAGLTALGALAYMLTRDSGEEEAPKKRRRAAMA